MSASAADPWAILAREVSSLFVLCGESTDAAFGRLSECGRELLVYNLAKQTRDVIDVLLSRPCRRDGAALSKIRPHFQCEALDELRAGYGDDSQADSPCWLLGALMRNPRLSGAARQRSAQALATAITAIDRVWRELSRAKPAQR